MIRILVRVGEAVFATWAPDGLLRHPSWRDLPPDRPEVRTYANQMIEADQLEVAGWRLVTGQLRSEGLPDLATDALVRVVDSPPYGCSPDKTQPMFVTRQDLFRLALTELGISLPDTHDALWSLVRRTANGIVDDTVGPAAGANQIWRSAYHRVEHSGDLRIFVGLASALDDRPEDRAAVEEQIVAAATELLLQRPRPRVWIKLMAAVGRSPVSRTAGDDGVEVDPADLPIGPQLVADVERWAARHRSVLAQWPRTAGFTSERAAGEFVARGAHLVSRLQAELGLGYQVEYMPEPIRPPGVKLARGHSSG